MRKSLNLPLAAVAMMLGSTLIGVSYAPISFWPGAVLGVAFFSISLSGRTTRQALLLGFLGGTVTNAITVGWVSVLGWYAGAGLIPAMSLWTMLLAWGIVRVQRLSAWPLWAACCWSAIEFGASSVPFGGFGWNRLAYTTADQPLSGFLPWLGVAGVSWLVALTGSLLGAAVIRRKPVLPLTVASVLFLMGGLVGLIPSAIPKTGGEVTVGIVQGNVDGVGHGNTGYATSVTNNHLTETIFLMAKVRTGQAPMPDFLLWPENSTDIDPTRDLPTRRQVELSARLAERPILVGAVMDGPGMGERQTAGLWWDPRTGPGERYDKRNLVPFGEWIPFRDFLLPRIPVLKQVGKQGVPGTRPGVLDVHVAANRQLRIGDAICFELAYDSTMYDLAENGAQVLVVQSNNATYTATGQPRQQFEITRIRAMEAGREIVVATTSSFSGLIQPDGTVTLRTEEATADSASVTVPLREGTTLGIALHPWFTWLMTLLALGAMVVSYRPTHVSKIEG